MTFVQLKKYLGVLLRIIAINQITIDLIKDFLLHEIFMK
jgi:hypothetical protein